MPYYIIDLGAEFDVFSVTLVTPQPDQIKLALYVSVPASCDVMPDFEVLVDEVSNVVSASNVIDGTNTAAVCVFGECTRSCDMFSAESADHVSCCCVLD